MQILSAWNSLKGQPEDITESSLDLNIKKYTQLQKERNESVVCTLFFGRRTSAY